MQLSNKNVFISGGAGVIGQELVPKLIGAGANVTVADLKPKPIQYDDDIAYLEGDLNDVSFETLQETNCQIFIHLAATFERSAETYDFWHENYRHNVRLSNYLMSKFKKLSTLERVVFASSYLIYDPQLYQFQNKPNEATKLNEAAPIRPRNLTGAAKLNHEIELRFLSSFEETKFTSTSARIFRGFGKNSRDVISRFIRQLINGEELEVYRPEGCFDYIYAEDTAEGLMRIAASKKCKEIVNLGTGKAHSINEIIEVLKQFFPEMKVNYRDSEIPIEASVADMNAFNEDIGWTPEIDIEKAIAKIVQYERQKHA